MAELKTKQTRASVKEFIDRIDDERTRADCRALVKIMRAATGQPPKMWGSAIVGFGTYHYAYPSGRTGEWMLTGFSPRKGNLSVYIMPGFAGYQKLLAKLGKPKTGKSCLYLERLADVDLAALRELVERSVAAMRKKHA